MPIARKHLCDWSNCDSEEVAISINYRGEERPTFCCEEHAAQWLQFRAKHRNGPIPRSPRASR